MASNPEPAISVEFAERLAGPLHAFGGNDPPRARVFPDALPPGLPVDLPLPPGARLLGSRLSKSPLDPYEASQGIRAEEDQADIYLDVPGDAESVFAFYDGAMRERGWTPPSAAGPSQRKGYGFQSEPLPRPPSRRFCAGPHGPWLSVTVYESAVEPSDVRIHVDLSDTSLCAPPSESLFEEPRIFSVLPALTLPKGARATGSRSSGGNDNEWNENTLAVTSLSVVDLERHYADQLINAGWVRRDSGVNGPLAWSTWSSPPPGTWEATFWVVEEPKPNHRYLHLRILRRGLRQRLIQLMERLSPDP